VSQPHSIAANPTVSPTDEAVFVGVDVGGTNIKVGIVSDSGTIVKQTQFATEQQLGPAVAMARAAECIDQLSKSSGVARDRLRAIGLGTPGPIDLDQGMILDPSNLPAWWNFPIRQTLESAAGLPVSFCNDANAAAMGEFWIGGGKQFGSLIMLTLGTGVGGGIVINNFLIEGAHGMASECGHVLIDSSPHARKCGCGRTGHLEAYASATAVVDRYCQRVGIERDKPTAKSIAELAAAGDQHAIAIIDETADYLGRAIGIFAHTIDPAAVILGGAMNFGGAESQLGKNFLQRVHQATCRETFSQIASNIQIRFAKLGGNAGWIGAAAIARRNQLRSQC